MKPHTVLEDRRRPRKSAAEAATIDAEVFERYEDDARIAARPRAEARRHAFYAQPTR